MFDARINKIKIFDNRKGFLWLFNRYDKTGDGLIDVEYLKQLTTGEVVER
jgi:Ca2+-binding EF-hand superfamily protein